MSITDFLREIGYRPHGAVANSWDAFAQNEAVFMQLWSAPGQRYVNEATPNVYLRVRCFDHQHFLANRERLRVGYQGRLRAIASIRNGARGHALLSAPPGDVAHGPGVWARYANFDQIYPVLALEGDPEREDAYVLLGRPIPRNAM